MKKTTQQKNHSLRPSFAWSQLKKPFSVLAPMENVTDSAFRRLVQRCAGPDVLFTEYINAQGLCDGNISKVVQRTVFHADEHPIIAQIWGDRPEHYYQATQLLIDLGFDGVDLNMGCPVPKAVQEKRCARLIEPENRHLAQELIAATQEAAGNAIPVSIKTRLGYHHLDTEAWGDFLLAQQPAALTLHGRTAQDMYRGSAHWDEIGKVVTLRNTRHSDTVVIGNGDVSSYADIQAKHDQTGVDGVMVGRAALHNPYLFHPDSIQFENMSRSEHVRLLLEHATIFEDTWHTAKSYAVLKKFIKIYTNHIENACKIRRDLQATQSITELKQVLQPYLNGS